MSKKMIQFGTQARKEVQNGMNTVVEAVASSYGPRGRNAIMGKSYGAPDISNDGVTIAKAIEDEGFEQLGVSLIQQAANKTNDEAGDGTSLTVTLSGSIVNEGIRVIEAGSDPVRVRAGLNKAKDSVLDYLLSVKKDITTENEMADVATISSRSRNIGEMIAKTLVEIGKDGVVSVQSGDSNSIEREVVQGMQFDKGYKSPYFVTDNQKMEAVVDNPKLLITDQKISNMQDILPLVEALAQQGKKELVVIADDIEGEALANFVVNKIRGVFNIFAVQAPAFGDRRKAMLKDIATLTGATYISSDLGMSLKNAGVEDLGQADKVVSDKDNTTIVGGKGDQQGIEGRAAEIRQAIEEASSDYDKEKLQERLAKLVGGVGVIKVGAATEVEMKELKYTVEDALNATKAAVAEGVVAGGASTLLRASKKLDQVLEETEDENEKVGVNIVRKALQYPFRAIAKNSGIYDVSILVNQIENANNKGYDFKKEQIVEDMIEAGIIDPALVLRQAISNAVSIGGSIITTEVLIADDPKEKDDSEGEGGGAAAGGGMPGMGGMGGMM
jgi:chaperonin GroEL